MVSTSLVARRALAAGRPVVVPNPSPQAYGIIAPVPQVVNAAKGRPREQEVGVSLHDEREWQALPDRPHAASTMLRMATDGSLTLVRHGAQDAADGRGPDAYLQRLATLMCCDDEEVLDLLPTVIEAPAHHRRRVDARGWDWGGPMIMKTCFVGDMDTEAIFDANEVHAR